MKKNKELGKQRGTLIPPNIRHVDKRIKSRSERKRDLKKECNG